MASRAGGEQFDFGAGLNIHFSGRSRVMVHIVHSDAQGASEFDGLMLRLHTGF